MLDSSIGLYSRHSQQGKCRFLDCSFSLWNFLVGGEQVDLHRSVNSGSMLCFWYIDQDQDQNLALVRCLILGEELSASSPGYFLHFHWTSVLWVVPSSYRPQFRLEAASLSTDQSALWMTSPLNMYLSFNRHNHNQPHSLRYDISLLFFSWISYCLFLNITS